MLPFCGPLLWQPQETNVIFEYCQSLSPLIMEQCALALVFLRILFSLETQGLFRGIQAKIFNDKNNKNL